MHPALDNAVLQWQEGDQWLRRSRPGEQAHLEGAVQAVLEGIRKRLGSSFHIAELAELYTQGTDWAEDVAARRWADLDAVMVVDAAFARYAREAADYAGGRMYIRR